MDIWQPLGTALGLGLLVGLQRERAKSGGAGIRTFPLITVLGTVCALLADTHGGWILGIGLLSVAALLVVANIARREKDAHPHPGQTTEVAALLMFAAGAMLATGQTAAAIAVSGCVAVLLQWKEPLHHFAERIGTDEIRALFRLVLVAMVVLPALPDRTFGPYEVLNPFRIWQMVVLIVGFSISGYVASKYFGPRAGSVVGGALGGLISSTATAASCARRTTQAPGSAALGALVVMIASTVVFVRVTAEVAIVAPGILPHVFPQFMTMAGIMTAISAGAYFVTPRDRAKIPVAGDPAELPAAVVFGMLYALVLIAVAVAQEHFGNRGLYTVAALSGLTDMDAITLSTAQLMESQHVGVDTGWRMMLVGALSNIAFKTGVIAWLGPKGLLLRVAGLFAIAAGAGGLLLWLWPPVNPL